MDGNQDTMAQAVFLAQLEAAKGVCKCSTCRILRRASTIMTAQFLKEPGAAANPPQREAGVQDLISLPEE